MISSNERLLHRLGAASVATLFLTLVAPPIGWAQPAKFRQRVNLSIDRASTALQPRLQEYLDSPPDSYPMGRIAICLTALLKSGLEPDHQLVTDALQKLQSLPTDQTYSVACYLFALDAYWQAHHRTWQEASRRDKDSDLEEVPRIPPTDGEVHTKITRLVEWLVNGSGGSWHYTGRASGDLSNTQFAVLGLEIGLQNGIDIPSQVFEAIAEHLVTSQRVTGKPSRFAVVYRTPAWKGVTDGRLEQRRVRARRGGWSYRFDNKISSTSNMVAAGLSSLLIARRGLQEYGAYTTDIASEVDLAIEQGLAWITANCNQFFGNDVYGLYGLEKVGDIARISRFGKVDWYLRGARLLVSQQRRDGMWAKSGHADATVRTALALLFLTRATQSSLQILGPPIFVKEEEGYRQEHPDLVHIPQVNGFMSASTLFAFLRETRDPKVIPLVAEAAKGYPPHLLHDLLAELIRLWTKKKDKTTRFAVKQLHSLTGLEKASRDELTTVVKQFRRLDQLKTTDNAKDVDLKPFLSSTKSPVFKRHLLTTIDRFDFVSSYETVIEASGDRDSRVAERAHEILEDWSERFREVADGDPPSRGKKAALLWQQWWSRHSTAILSQWSLHREIRLLHTLGGSEENSERVDKLVRKIVDYEKAAVPSLLSALQEGEYSIHHIVALEKISGKRLGVRANSWRRWWTSEGGNE